VDTDESKVRNVGGIMALDVIIQNPPLRREFAAAKRK
jgi:hypothetical protein